MHQILFALLFLASSQIGNEKVFHIHPFQANV